MTGGPLEVAVVGGGISGLAAAYALESQMAQGGVPVAVTLFEAGHRLGGKLQTERVGRLLLERGPDALFLRTPLALDFCRRVGLGDEVVAADPRHRQSAILRGGRLHPLPEGMESGVPRSLRTMALSGLLSPLGKARAALELALPAAAADGDESVDAFIRRRFGAEVAERIAAPLLGGIYTTDTRRLSLLATAPHLREAERRHRSLLQASWRQPAPGAGSNGAVRPGFVALRGGLGSLAEAVQARLTATRVRLRTPARALLPDRRGFLLRLADGEQVRVDRVVLAAPAPAAAELLAPLAPSAAELLARVRCGSVAVVVLAFPPAAAAGLPAGSGFVVGPAEPGLLAACSWSSRKWPHCAPDGELLVRAHVHADRRPEVLRLDDAALVEAVRAELRTLLGVAHAPLVARVFRWPSAMPSYEVGHLDRVAAVEAALAEFPGLALAGAAYRGVGIPECIRQGQEAAARVLLAGGVASIPAWSSAEVSAEPTEDGAAVDAAVTARHRICNPPPA